MKEKEIIETSIRSIELTGLNYHVTVSSSHNETLRYMVNLGLAAIEELKNIESNNKEV